MARPRRAFSASLVALTVAVSLATVQPAAPAGAGPAVTTMPFKVTVGPASAREVCDVEGDLYIPGGVNAGRRAPTLLTPTRLRGSESSLGTGATTPAEPGATTRGSASSADRTA